MINTRPRKLITFAHFGRLVNRNRRTISDIASQSLSKAVVDGKIDLTHADVQAYIKRCLERDSGGSSDIDDLPPSPPPLPVEAIDTTPFNGLPPTDYLEGTEIESLGDMTLRELATRFGTCAQFIEWLNARKKIVDISEKEIKNAKLRDELIPREFVQKFIIQQFERTNMNLLNDAPKTISSELSSLIKSGCTLEDAESLVEKVLSTHILAGKDYVNRMIEQA